MKTILCYGDSNTFGYIPETGMRYPFDVLAGPFEGTFDERSVEESYKFSDYYNKVAEDKGCVFFDASDVIRPSSVDGLHLSAESHKRLARSFYDLVSSIVG